jgi:hypothetical protein
MSEARARLDALPAAYPRVFPRGGVPWGFAVGDGWCLLLETLCARLDSILLEAPGVAVEVKQVKEKFGGLRFYYSLHGADTVTAEAIREAVNLAETASKRICEKCGRPGELRDGGWLRVLCAACHAPDP